MEKCSGSHSPAFEHQFCLTWMWNPSLGLNSLHMGGAAGPTSKGGAEDPRMRLTPGRCPVHVTFVITTITAVMLC